MPRITDVWAKQDKESVNYFRGLAFECKRKGLTSLRRTYIAKALDYRKQARKWSAWPD